MTENIYKSSFVPDSSAEEKILLAAKDVFMKKGFDGARMQEIADKAGINKALVHYYFRSKDNLFVAVFQSAVNKLFPSLFQIFLEEGTIIDKITAFFDLHMGFLIENPLVPRFIVNEMSGHPERLEVFFNQIKELEIFKRFEALINERIKAGEIREIEPVQLLLNLISLSIFPILAEPMIKGVLHIEDDDYKKILDDRKTIAADFVIRSIAL